MIKTNGYVYIFDCLDCGQFYGEQSLTADGRLLCPSCFSQQAIDADCVERMAVPYEVEPFTAGILCEDCAEPINRDGFETYCYKCDLSFGQV